MNPQNQDQSERFRKPPVPDEVPEDRLIVCVGIKAYFNVGEKKNVKDSKPKQ